MAGPAAAALTAPRPAPVASEGGREDFALRGTPGWGSAAFWLDHAPAWLSSGLLHLTALLLLAMFALGENRDVRLLLTVGLAGEEGEDILLDELDLAAPAELEVEEPTLATNTLPEVADPLATPPDALITPQGLSLAGLSPSVAPGAALDGRRPGSKEALLRAMGGTAGTESAVLEGLRWLAKQQRRDGGWSLQGPYPGGAANENREAATAMALLAFQGAGKLPGNSRGDFGREVRRGWEWLLKRQNPDGSFFHFGGMNHRFYTHAMCTIAVCELLAMTGDDKYRPAAQKAVKYLIDTQSAEGGWKYEPQSQSDLSVTGWVLMALKSGRLAGIEVPSPVFGRIEGFLDSVAQSDPDGYGPVGSRYVYEPSDVFNYERVPAMTAVGILCREYLGWPLDDRRITSGVDFLLTHPPEWRRGKVDVYYWYYATQAILHAGGPTWPRWNNVMREMLPAQQVARGAQKGSWDSSEDAWGASGGRLYTTCLAIYTLEVYYRHLPLYQQQAVR